jgi:hypothetical protein
VTSDGNSFQTLALATAYKLSLIENLLERGRPTDRRDGARTVQDVCTG